MTEGDNPQPEAPPQQEAPAQPEAAAAPPPQPAAQAGKTGALQKNQEVNINELDPALRRVHIGLGWDAPEEQDGNPIDIDASAFLLNNADRVRQDTDFIFYNNLDAEGGAIKHLGDNTTGETAAEKEGDAEVIDLNLENIPFDVEKIAFSVTIHNAADRSQNFGVIKNAYMRVINAETGVELVRYDLTEDASGDTAMIFGELYRDGLGWKFKALGVGSEGGLYEIARGYGVNVAPP